MKPLMLNAFCKLLLMPQSLFHIHCLTKLKTFNCFHSTQVMDQAVIMGHTSCRVEIPMTLDTSETFAIDVYAATDNMYDGSHDMTLDVRTPTVHQSHWIWQNYELPPASVIYLFCICNILIQCPVGYFARSDITLFTTEPDREDRQCKDQMYELMTVSWLW